MVEKLTRYAKIGNIQGVEYMWELVKLLAVVKALTEIELGCLSTIQFAIFVSMIW